MNNKKVRILGVAIICAILLGGAYYYLVTSEEPGPTFSNDLPVPTTPLLTESSGEAPVSDQGVASTSPGERKPIDTKLQVSKVIEPLPDEKLIEEQKRLLSKFKSEIKLDIKLPENMIFEALDVEDEIEVIYGQGVGIDREMAVLASRAKASPETIINFLNEAKDSIPMLKEGGFKKSGSIQSVTPPKETGLKSVTLIPGHEKSGKRVMAAYLVREDNQGSYLFLMEANPSYFENNDGTFEEILNSIKVRP